MPENYDHLQPCGFDIDGLVTRKLTAKQRDEEHFYVNRRIDRIKANEFSTDDETERLRDMLRAMLLGYPYALPTQRKYASCGTMTAYRRHVRAQEEICPACAQARTQNGKNQQCQDGT